MIALILTLNLAFAGTTKDFTIEGKIVALKTDKVVIFVDGKDIEVPRSAVLRNKKLIIGQTVVAVYQPDKKK